MMTMRIINAHLHLIEIEKIKDAPRFMDLMRSIPAFGNVEESLKLLSPEALLAQMDEAGIEQGVLFACLAPVLYSSNEYVGELCRRHPDRFIGFASVHPAMWNPAKKLERAVKAYGLRGVKFHPPLQNFFPNDRRMFPVYKKAIDLNLPVVFHVGTTPFGPLVKLAQANPLLLDDVAVRFPKLKIVLTHLGTLWHNEAFMVAEKHANVYVDTAAYLYEIRDLLTEDLVRRVGVEKFIFGTDYPMPAEGRPHRMRDFVDCVNRLALPDDVKERIFHKNFEKLMR
jgi:predicted TIM-barrel fold metal-dependent hydrolase